MERFFGIRPHKDLRADLERLTPEELSAAYRVASEALWNAAKHSGATNVRLESRDIYSITFLKVKDDGDGFPEGEIIVGSGISFIRTRSKEAGGILEIFSNPYMGTTVQIKFEKK